MTTVYYFSGSGHSFAVAKALSLMVECPVTEIPFDGEAAPQGETAVVVFPVYCQNIPKPVKHFLKTLSAKRIALIATYGRISYGNVLYEAQKLVHGQIIAGAYIPIGHSFLDADAVFDTKYLLPIAQRIRAPRSVRIPKTPKNPLANIFPALRSRMGVKITKADSCSGCRLCEAACPTGAFRNGRIHAECIRCLKCVTNCPQKALRYQNSWVLDQYLKRYYKEEYVLYV